MPNIPLSFQVNPTTAYNMLDGFVKLQAGDWVIQNGANSAVGLNGVYPLNRAFT